MVIETKEPATVKVEEAARILGIGRQTAYELAADGNVVIVGRGSSIILRDMPKVLRVGVVANWWDCVSRIMEQDHLTKEQATQAVIDRDKARTHYFKRFFGVDDPDKPEFYHLVVNTSDMGLGHAADLVAQAADALEEGWLT